MIEVVGSFLLVWFGIWSLATLLLVATYHVARGWVVNLYPGFSSGLLLVLLALPMLFSLLCAALLFSPWIESLLVSEHCHSNCETHSPLAESAPMTLLGFGLLILLCLFLFKRWREQMKSLRALRKQLHSLSEPDPSQNFRILDDETPLVFTLGWWRNTVYVSRGLTKVCDEQQLAAVMQHEQAHVLRKDNIRLLLAELVTVLIPKRLLKQIFNDLKLATESACDIHAGERLGHLIVADVFVKIQRLIPRINNLPNGVVAMDGASIERRVLNLLNVDKLYRPSKFEIVSAICIGVMTIGLLLDPLHHLAEWFFLQR